MSRFKRIDGAWREQKARFKYLAGSWRRARKAYKYASGAWRLYFVGADPVNVTIAPVNGDFNSFQNSSVTGTLIASVSGGLAPFTYSWAVAYHSGTAPTFSAPGSATTGITQTGVGASDTEVADISLIVTDSAGQSGTASKSLTFTNIDFS